jgi:hypothetical protein
MVWLRRQNRWLLSSDFATHKGKSLGKTVRFVPIASGRGGMVDTQGLGPCAVKSVGVRVLSSAQQERKNLWQEQIQITKKQ